MQSDEQEMESFLYLKVLLTFLLNISCEYIYLILKSVNRQC